MSLFRCPPSFPFSLPHTDYSFKVNYSPCADSPAAIVELRIRQKYMLFLEPIKGQKVTMEDDYMVSPELTVQFKIPLWLLFTDPAVSYKRDLFVSVQLRSLPIGPAMAEFLKPHIQNHAILRAQETQNRKPFKMIFSVTALKIDLADHKECLKIRAQGRSGFRKLKS